MADNPYKSLPGSAFWKSGVAESSPLTVNEFYRKKWPINPSWKIGTAGSCFAQHIARHLRMHGFKVLDMEPPPRGLDSGRHNEFGYALYSARYSNIYTVRQLLQLLQEASGKRIPGNVAWERDGRFYDALRPSVEPSGLSTADEVMSHREVHLREVKTLFETMDLFVFTMGLTEAWVDKETQTVFPTAPGTIAGRFDVGRYEFVTFNSEEIYADWLQFFRAISELRGGRPLRMILTVSPVPLTATASGKHVMLASTYSKSVLRAVAGRLCDTIKIFDYFPSYEIITNPASRGVFFATNLRSVTTDGVSVVMNCFFGEHSTVPATQSVLPSSDVQCEDAMLEAFMG